MQIGEKIINIAFVEMALWRAIVVLDSAGVPNELQFSRVVALQRQFHLRPSSIRLF
jgi:hypothetical protein